MKAAGLIALCFLVYWPCLRGEFLWDDDAYISQNDTLKSVQGLRDIWFKPGAVPQYYPLTFSVFWVERQLWGLNPLGYHAVNILLHGANAVLLGFILTGMGISGGWIAALLFAVHPVNVESVAWMTELKNVLSTFFYLWTLFFLLKKNRPWPALACFACALLSKTVALTLPVSFFLLFIWKKGAFDKEKARQLAPLFVMSLVAAFTTRWYEHHWVRAEGGVWELSLVERAAISGRAFWFYLSKLLWPSGLSFIYPRWSLHGLQAAWFLWPASAILFLTGIAYGRRLWGKLPFACLLYFTLTLGPTLGLVSFYFMRFSFVADHFQYLAGIGVLTLAGWIFSKGLKTLKVAYPNPAGIVLVSLVCLPLALASFSESRKYQNSLALWTHTLERNPDSAFVHHNLGIAFSEGGQWRDAVAHLRTAEALDPTYPQTHLALAYYAAGAKRWPDAKYQYEEAIKWGIKNPPPIWKDFPGWPYQVRDFSKR